MLQRLSLKLTQLVSNKSSGDLDVYHADELVHYLRFELVAARRFQLAGHIVCNFLAESLNAPLLDSKALKKLLINRRENLFTHGIHYDIELNALTCKLGVVILLRERQRKCKNVSG